MGGLPTDSREVKSYYKREKIDVATDARQVFRESSLYPQFDPSKRKFPIESLDSVGCPQSGLICLCPDVTGSMNDINMNIIQKVIPAIIRDVFDAKLSYNPQIMFMAVGDVTASDRAPLQVTDAETDLRIISHLQKIWLECGGGFYGQESYNLPWYLASKHIEMDCYNKRGRKGLLITFGDESVHDYLSARDVKAVFGDNDSLDVPRITSKDCLERASEKFNCYHIVLKCYSDTTSEARAWKELMGSRACLLGDYDYMDELVTTIILLNDGVTKTEALGRIKDTTARRHVEYALADHEEKIDVEVVASAESPNVELF